MVYCGYPLKRGDEMTEKEVTYKGTTIRCDGYRWIVIGWSLADGFTRHKTLKAAKTFVDNRLADEAKFGKSAWCNK